VVLVATSPPSFAVANRTVGSGSLTRVQFFEHAGFAGGVFTVRGTGQCTAELTDHDDSISYVSDAWNDQISSGKDFNNCDVQVYEDVNFGGSWYPSVSPYYRNMGSGWDATAVGWNDRISSFYVS
jgi:hypothetical protein